MNFTDKVYNIMKTSMNKSGFVLTVSQIARELNIADHETNGAVEQLRQQF